MAIQTSSNTLPGQSESAPVSQKSNRVTFIKSGMRSTGIQLNAVGDTGKQEGRFAFSST